MPDSTACTDRALLRRAFPAGFLAVPGLATVGGWRCVRLDQWGTPWWSRPDGLYPHPAVLVYVGEADEPNPVAAGDLLPLVDPVSPGDWAIVLHDLALATEAAGLASLLHRPLTGFDFCCWRGEEGDCPPDTRHFILTVHDPAGRNFVDFHLPLADLAEHGWNDQVGFDVRDGRAWTRENIALALVLARIAVREKGF